MNDVFDLKDEGTNFFCSSKLMEAVRALDYKGQYKVCVAFYNEIIKYPQ